MGRYAAPADARKGALRRNIMVEKTVTRADLAEAVYRLNIENRQSEPAEPISREESAGLVEAVLDEIVNALVEGDTVKLSSFGAFSVREKGARIGRNPKTGVEAPISPRRVPSFRASQVLKAHINDETPVVKAAENSGASKTKSAAAPAKKAAKAAPAKKNGAAKKTAAAKASGSSRRSADAGA